MTTIRRKLYRRGSSFETTIPMPLLFAIDKTRKHDVLFHFDAQSNRWYIELEQAGKEEAVPVKKAGSASGKAGRSRKR